MVVLVSRKGNFKTGVLIENGVFPRKLLHSLCWEKTKEDTLNLSTFDGDSALKSLPAGLIGGFTTTDISMPSSSETNHKRARPSTISELRSSIHMTIMFLNDNVSFLSRVCRPDRV